MTEFQQIFVTGKLMYRQKLGNRYEVAPCHRKFTFYSSDQLKLKELCLGFVNDAIRQQYLIYIFQKGKIQPDAD